MAAHHREDSAGASGSTSAILSEPDRTERVGLLTTRQGIWYQFGSRAGGEYTLLILSPVPES